MKILEIMKTAVEAQVSDVFLIAGRPITFRKNGVLEMYDDRRLMPQDTELLLDEIYELAERHSVDMLKIRGDDDFSFAVAGLSRFRVSAYKQRNSLSAVIRVISFETPDYRALGIPEDLIRLGSLRKGMVLVTGPAGSGKSTTLACIIDQINQNQAKHIITLEDPLEYLHRHKKSIVSQREINVDTETYLTALRAALRQSPDVIQLGEMRDYETIQVAMTAAEAGHLLFSTLHTIGAANTIERIIDVFPANQQQQIRVQLSMTLQAVISQQLIPAVGGGVVPAFEVMIVTPAIRNMIRENKIPQIGAQLYSSGRPDMLSMDMSLQRLYKEGRITREDALLAAVQPELLEKKL